MLNSPSFGKGTTPIFLKKRSITLIFSRESRFSGRKIILYILENKQMFIPSFCVFCALDPLGVMKCV